MSSVTIHITCFNLVLLLMVISCQKESEPSNPETCEDFQSLNSIIRVMKSVNSALGDILASATLRAESIEDDVCSVHKTKNVTVSDNDYCVKRERDCNALLRLGLKKNGIYRIWPQFLNRSVLVYCNMEEDGGGWTVIQRRGEFGKPHINFFRSWDDYKVGFGDLEEEFWLGNDIIFALTNQAPTILRIDMEDYENQTRYAKYLSFVVRSEVEQYKLLVDNYRGTAGDAMKDHSEEIFQTADRGSECSRKWKGGWWYEDCFRANLNGVYYNESVHLNYRDGVSWIDFRDQNNSLKMTEMKIRPLLT